MAEESTPTTGGNEEPEVKRRRTAADLFPDVPEVESAPDNSLSFAEMAGHLGVGRQALTKYKNQEGFPAPVGRRGRTLFFDKDATAEWHANRLTGMAPQHRAAGIKTHEAALARDEANIAGATARGAGSTSQSITPSPVARMIPGTASAADQFKILDAYYGPKIQEAAQREAKRAEENTKLGQQFNDLFGF
jgi:hypothetical protein